MTNKATEYFGLATIQNTPAMKKCMINAKIEEKTSADANSPSYYSLITGMFCGKLGMPMQMRHSPMNISTNPNDAKKI